MARDKTIETMLAPKLFIKDVPFVYGGDERVLEDYFTMKHLTVSKKLKHITDFESKIESIIILIAILGSEL